MKERIENKLNQNIKIDDLEVINESYLHAGHMEGGGDETHFRIKIKSDDFKGKSLVEAHRMINEILKEDIKKEGGIHALSIKIIK